MSTTNSPLYRRRQARGLSMDDAYAISEAGRDRVTETIGLQVGGVGTALQAALEKGRKAKGERDAQAKTVADEAKRNDENQRQRAKDTFGKLSTEMEVTPTMLPASSIDVTPAVEKETASRTYTDAMAWRNLGEDEKVDYAKRGITNLYEFTNHPVHGAEADRKKNPGRTNIATEDDKRDTARSTEWAGIYGAGSGVREEQEVLNTGNLLNSPGKRLSPLNRRSAGRAQRFRQEAASVYGTGPIPVGSDDSSQYEEGKTFVDKEYRLAGASFMGNAAIEGYNMAVDKRNYEKQVNADMIDYVNGATKGLDIEATGISVLDRSISEASIEMKKKFFEHQKSRDQFAAEGRLGEWDAQNTQYKNFSAETKGLLDGLRSGITEIGEKVKSGEIDENASNPAGFSLFTSLHSGDAEIGIVNTENGPTLMGATKHNDPINIMARGINDALSGLQFIPKQEPTEFYNDFMTRLKDNKVFGVEKQATVLPNGNEIMAYNTGGLNNALDVYIKEELKDPNDLRGYASALLGWSYGQYDAVVDSGKDPREIVAGKMREDMDGLLSNVKGYKSEETTGLSTALANEQINIRKETRTGGKPNGSKNGGATDYDNAARDILSGGQDTSLETFTIGEDGNIIEQSKKQLFKTYPGLNKIEGADGVGQVKYNQGILTVYGPQGVTEVEQEGQETKTTRKTEVLTEIDLTGNAEQAVQKVSNLLRQIKYKQVSPNISEGAQSENITEEEAKAKLAEIQNRISGT